MEFPEVLSNIKNEEPDIEIEKNKQTVREGFDFLNYTEEDWDGHDTINDNAGDINGLSDPRQIIINFINYVYNTTISYNRLLALKITNSLSNNKNVKEINKNADVLSKSIKKSLKVSDASGNNVDASGNIVYTEGNIQTDETRVYNYICLFEAIIFSSFVVNNWYYLMFYNNFKDGEKVNLFDFSADKIKSLSDDYFTNKFLKYILLYFIEYALFFPEKLEYFLLDLIPGVSVKFFNHTLCYIFLFMILCYLSYNFASGFKNFLIDVINVNSKNFIVSLMYITVIIVYCIPDGNPTGEYFKTKNPDVTKGGDPYTMLEQDGGKQASADPSVGTKILNNLASGYNSAASIASNVASSAAAAREKAASAAAYAREKAAAASSAYKSAKENVSKYVPKPSATTVTTVFKIIWDIIRFLIIVGISVPIGGFFCIFYFVFYSIYAMLFYSDWDLNKVSDVFKDMLKFIDDPNQKVKFDENPTFFQMLIKKLNQYLEYFSDNIFILAFLYGFVRCLTDTLKNVTNTTLKNTLYMLDLSFIFIILFFLMYLIKAKFKLSSFSDIGQLAKNIMNSSPIEKDYDFSTSIFYLVNLSVFLLSSLSIGYLLLLIADYNFNINLDTNFLNGKK
jgi:hypothetical protein